MELPNRRFPVPPPFMFHPELQPEFAALNPTNLVPLKIHKRSNIRTRQPAKLGVTLVASDSE